MRRRQALPALERHAGLKDPRRPASLMHVCIVVSLMAGVRPEEVRAIGWEQDVDLDCNPPWVAVLRADRAGGVVIVATVDAAADLDRAARFTTDFVRAAQPVSYEDWKGSALASFADAWPPPTPPVSHSAGVLQLDVNAR